MFEKSRRALREALESKRLDLLPGVRLARELIGPARGERDEKPPAPTPRRREPAPVMVYVEWDSPGRDDVEKLLKERSIPYRLLAVDRDDATKQFLRQTAKRSAPVVFIATEVVGWYDELRALDASGELTKRVFGT